MTLYLLKYNNYYNRTLKKFDTIDEYSSFVVATFEGVNFNPNDGTQTEQVVNYNGDMPDYLIAVDDTGTIDSRWYIIESQRTRAQQFKMTLFRDCIADFYDEIVNAPMYVEKAFLAQSDPLIFNSEDMTFNQIKTSETPLKDETNSAWLVGYCTRDTIETSISADIKYNAPVDIALSNINAYEYYTYSNLAPNPQEFNGFPSKVIYNVYSKFRLPYDVNDLLLKISFNEDGAQTTGPFVYAPNGATTTDTGYTEAYVHYNFTGPANAPTGVAAGCDWPLGSFSTTYTGEYTDYRTFVKGFKDYYTPLKLQLPHYVQIKSQDETIRIENQHGKIIYDSSNDVYYQVSVTKSTVKESEVMIPSGVMYNTFVNAMNGVAQAWVNEHPGKTVDNFFSEVWIGSPNTGSFSVRTTGVKYSITLTKLPDRGMSYKVQFPDERYQLEDAPYDMFCMPFSDDLDIYQGGVLRFKSSKSLAWQTFMSLASKYKQAGFIYDIQLLPYCPVRYCIKSDGTFDIGSNIVGTVTQTKNTVDTIVAYIMFGSKASDSFVIPYNISITDNKLQGQTDLWRLVSPNYSGQFEFNAAKNNGVEWMEVDYTYKPYTPYIHISPNFKNLYGQDFNDARGLICGGDYSLPSISSQWDTYELQNKNYQLAFDRQIQNMEIQNNYQKVQDIAHAITGTVTGGMSGAMAGSVAGGPGGAVAGGVVGILGSAIGGAIDVGMNEELRKEAIDFSKDQFGYSLGNIQALPYTLNKVSAFNANNKIFPFIEYYTCTDTEKKALINKIKYNGMTVGTIGTMSDYIGNTYRDFDRQYIKCKLIRLEGIADDFHVVNTIAEELYKGVFV